MPEQLLTNKAGFISENAPKRRCYKCGDPDIRYIRHHCGKPMCNEHTFFVSDKGKLISKEFTKLKLDNEGGEEPYHCEHCIHIIRGQDWKLIVAGIIFIFLSLIAVPNNRFGVKLMGFLIGGGGVGYGFYTNNKRKIESRKFKPLLPVLPRFNRVQIEEELSSRIILDSEGNYHVSEPSAKGQLNIDMSLTNVDCERLEQYRKKYGSADRFHGGFAVLEGLAGLQFSDHIVHNQNDIKPNSTVIPLIDKVSTQPLLNGVDERNAEKIRKCFPYSLIKIPERNYFPIQLVLSFLPETDKRGIEIGIQGTKPDSNGTELWEELLNLEIDRIESLELTFPVSWGKVQNLSRSDNAVINYDTQTITWRRVKLTEQDSKNRCTLQVQFENSIDPLDSSVCGKVKVLFQGTLSGLNNVSIYLPTGKPGRTLQKKNKDTNSESAQEQLIVNTEVDADFELSLASLRYQHIKEITEDNKNKIKINKPGNLFFPGGSPNYETILILTDAMSKPDQGFYVKQVIENQPTIAANVINHVWTIFGRWYEGIYPIDFQLDVEGQESNEKTIQEDFLGLTTVKLTVKGTHSNPEMEQQIEGVWEKLNFLINETLTQLSQQTSYREQEALPPSLEVMEAELEYEDEQQ